MTTYVNYIIIIYPTTNYRKLTVFGFFWIKDTLVQKIARKWAGKCQLIQHLKDSKQVSLTTYHVPEGNGRCKALFPLFTPDLRPV